MFPSMKHQQTINNCYMKKTLIALLAMSGVAVAATPSTSSHVFSGSNTYKAGTEVFSGYELVSSMTTGTATNFTDAKEDLKSTNITIGDYYIGNYTVSLWVETSSLNSNHMIVAFSHSTSSDNFGYNGLTWDAEGHTLTLGRGNFKANDDTIAFSGTPGVSGDLSSYYSTKDSLVNFTLSSSGADENQVVTLYVNGKSAFTYDSYVTKMNGSGGGGVNTETYTWVSKGGVKYGTVSLTNEALTTQADVLKFIGVQNKNVPEPTTGTLSLLALAGLCARRRKH